MTTRCNISMMRMRDVHAFARSKTEGKPILIDKPLENIRKTILQSTQYHLLSDRLKASHTIAQHKKFIESP